jgi:hypothetical protein
MEFCDLGFFGQKQQRKELRGTTHERKWPGQPVTDIALGAINMDRKWRDV